MIEQAKQELIALSSSQMANFSYKLIPNSLPILGVSIPNIRKLAKKLCKLDFRNIIAEYDSSSFELQMLVGIIIATAPLSLEERFTYLNEFIPKIQDWAVCDCLVNSLKCCKDYLNETFDFILKYKTSQKEFEVRFLVVMLMTYFINNDYYLIAYQIVCELYLEDYYSKMAVAWFLATLMINHQKEVFEYLEDDTHDAFIIMKTISKIQESYRISKEDKLKVLKYRKKQ